jgi:hypothetical protein
MRGSGATHALSLVLPGTALMSRAVLLSRTGALMLRAIDLSAHQAFYVFFQKG